MQIQGSGIVGNRWKLVKKKKPHKIISGFTQFPMLASRSQPWVPFNVGVLGSSSASLAELSPLPMCNFPVQKKTQSKAYSSPQAQPVFKDQTIPQCDILKQTISMGLPMESIWERQTERLVTGAAQITGIPNPTKTQ